MSYRNARNESGLEISTRGKTYPVGIDGDGNFSCEVNGERQVRPTFAALKSWAQSVAAKNIVELPIYQLERDRFDDDAPLKFIAGKWCGKHSNGNTLVRWGDGKIEQMHNWRGERLLRNLTKADKAAILKADAVKRAAAKAYDALIEKLKFVEPDFTQDQDRAKEG